MAFDAIARVKLVRVGEQSFSIGAMSWELRQWKVLTVNVISAFAELMVATEPLEIRQTLRSLLRYERKHMLLPNAARDS